MLCVSRVVVLESVDANESQLSLHFNAINHFVGFRMSYTIFDSFADSNHYYDNWSVLAHFMYSNYRLHTRRSPQTIYLLERQYYVFPDPFARLLWYYHLSRQREYGKRGRNYCR